MRPAPPTDAPAPQDAAVAFAERLMHLRGQAFAALRRRAKLPGRSGRPVADPVFVDVDVQVVGIRVPGREVLPPLEAVSAATIARLMLRTR